MGTRTFLLRAAAGHWASLLPLTAGAAVTAGFLSGLGALLELPQSPGGLPSAVIVSATGDPDLFGAILGFWRASGGMQALVAMYLAVDTLLFIPLYALCFTGLRAVLRRRNHPGLMKLARWRNLRLVACAAATADFAENALTAGLALTAMPLDQQLQPVLQVVSRGKWVCVSAMLIGLLALVVGRAVMLGWPGLRRLGRRLLELIRDLAAYLWAYGVPLAMLAAGIGVLAALPQTREVLLGLRSATARADGSLFMGFVGLAAWLAASAWSFKLLDGLEKMSREQRDAAPANRLRARHQLLLGIASLLSTTQLFVTFVPAATPVTATVIACGSVILWLGVVMAWEAGFQSLRLPRNLDSTLVSAAAVAWTCVALLLAWAAWFWLPIPNADLVAALGFFQPPDGVWRFNARLFNAPAVVALSVAVFCTSWVVWSVGKRSPGAAAAYPRPWRTVVIGALVWLAVALSSVEPEIVLYQVLLIAVLASSVWVFARVADDEAYVQWWGELEAGLKVLQPRLPAAWLALASRWLRRELAEWLRKPLGIFVSLLIVLVIVGNVRQPTLAAQLGTLTIVFVGVAAWGLACTWLCVYLPKRHGLGNWTLAPVLWAAVVAPGPRFSDDLAQKADPLRAQAAPLPTLHEHFQAWRKGLPDPQESPVFVVAAAGGGLRAAYWTALLLAQMDDRTCGQFGRHVLAMSGVSGGSVGIALYAAQRRVWERKPVPQRCDPGRVDELRAVLRNDYLSPVLASMLFADLPQALVPFRYRNEDRSQALSGAFLEFWARGFPDDKDLLSMPLPAGLPALRAERDAALATAQAGSHPVVYLNATSVETGRRVIASNVDLAGIPADPLYFEDRVSRGTRLLTADRSLIDAALDSARFPGVSPAGPIWACSPQFGQGAGAWCDAGAARLGRDVWFHVVDGGFFENSGLETIKDALASLRAARSLSVHGKLPPVFLIAIGNDANTKRLCSAADRPTPRLRVLGMDQRAVDQLTVLQAASGSGLVARQGASSNGPLSAVDTLLSVRDARARLELQRAVSEFGCPFVLEWSLGDLLPDAHAEPALGWMLSSRSFDLMDTAARQYGQAFPFDQAACAPGSSVARGLIGAGQDPAKRCAVPTAEAATLPQARPGLPQR